jgi:L-threonylcarbamoyladenylate synthase
MISLSDLNNTANVIVSGGVVAIPTEGVWGLSCQFNNFEAVHRVIRIKTRAPEKGFIILVKEFSELANWYGCRLRAEAMLEIGRPSTWIIPATPDCPDLLTGGRETLAVRRVTMPFLKALVDRTGPLISTSANVSGRPACMHRYEVMVRLGTHLDFVSRARPQGYQKPSTIRDMKTGALLRR